jgi:uncharacterized protein YdeI (YjbR/CyaY-like superfamily)
VHDRTSLRAWLEANHDTSPGVRLAIGKKGGSATALTYTDAIEEALCFGWIDSMAGRLDSDRFTVLFTRRKPGSGWSRSNKVRVARLTSNGTMTAAGLAVIGAAKADGSWNALDDVEDLVVPPDLAQALACDETARVGFEAASESARKMALHWIAGAKRPGTRANRIGEIVSRAAQGLPLA